MGSSFFVILAASPFGCRAVTKRIHAVWGVRKTCRQKRKYTAVESMYVLDAYSFVNISIHFFYFLNTDMIIIEIIYAIAFHEPTFHNH